MPRFFRECDKILRRDACAGRVAHRVKPNGGVIEQRLVQNQAYLTVRIIHDREHRHRPWDDAQ